MHEVDVTRFLFGEEIASVQIIKPAANPARTGRALRPADRDLPDRVSGRHVDVELFVTTGVAYEVRTEVVARTGQRHDRSRRRAGAQDRSPAAWGGQITPGFRERFGRPTTSSCSAGSTRCGPASTSTGPTAWDGYAAAAVCAAGVRVAGDRRARRRRSSR